MTRSALNARAWLIWIAAASVVTLQARNPLYALLLLLVALTVDQVCARANAEVSLPLLRLAVVVVVFSGTFNALFVHTGATILFRLPATLPLIGGPITLEALLFGVISGLVLLVLLAFFVAFNHALPPHELARLAPRGLQDLGVVVLIAITYVPETTRHLRRIKEAQAVRGHQLRGLRDWRPLVIPLLVGGMERALTLSEAMVARGFGATESRRQRPGVLAGIATSLVLVLAGWLLSLVGRSLGWWLLTLGMVLLAWLVWQSGRRATGTRYRQRPWRAADTLVVVSSTLPAMLVLLPLPFINKGSLTYSPFPRVQLPAFDPVLAFTFLLLLTPALLTLASAAKAQEKAQ